MPRNIYDKKELAELARANCFTSDNVEQVLRLYDILNCFSKDDIISSGMALKGGTALNLFVFEKLPRISVDLDFDIIGMPGKEEYLAKWPEMETHIREIVSTLGYEIDIPERKRYGLTTFLLPYRTCAGGSAKIKLEINYQSRVHVYEPVRKTVKSIFNDEVYGVVLLNPTEIIAEKINALLERCKPRDVYDIYTLSISTIDYDRNLLRRCSVFHGAFHGMNAETIQGRIDSIREMKFQLFKQQLIPMLRIRQGKFEMKLIQDAAADYVKDLFELTDNEEEYLNCYSAGYYKPELLYEGTEIGELPQHPKAKSQLQKL